MISVKKMKIDTKKSGYNYFVAEFWTKERDNGEILSWTDAKSRSNWTDLTNEEREEYKKIANRKGDQYVDEWVERIHEEIKEQERKKEFKKMVTQSKIKDFMDYVFENDWETRNFYIAHVNYYVKVNKTYCPGEIAIARYSVRMGLDSFENINLYCGELPKGYANEARQRSANINKLEIPLNPKNDSYNQAKLKLRKFLNNIVPMVVFAQDDIDKNDLAAVADTLLKIFQIEISVAPIEKLFIHILVKLRPDCLMSFGEASKFLREYRPLQIACDHHYSTDSSSYCSQNHVVRLCTLMTDAFFNKENDQSLLSISKSLSKLSIASEPNECTNWNPFVTFNSAESTAQSVKPFEEIKSSNIQGDKTDEPNCENSKKKEVSIKLPHWNPFVTLDTADLPFL